MHKRSFEVIALWSSKGGSGVSVTTAMLSLGLARLGRRPTIIDLRGDQGAIHGCELPSGPGFGDWLATKNADSAALARLSTDCHVVDLVGAGRFVCPAQPEVHLAQLDDDYLLDAGTISADSDAIASLVRASRRSYIVLRPCYLAVRRAAALAMRADGILLINEPHRSLRSSDIADVLGIPVMAEIEFDPAIARAVDAGRLHHRSFRLGRPLERLARSIFDGGALADVS